MASITSVVQELEGISGRIEKNYRHAVTAFGVSLLSSLRSNSPVVTGQLKYGWVLSRAASSNGVAEVALLNKERHASAIDLGIDPTDSKHSWAQSIARGSNKKIKKAVGIMPKALKIWSSYAVGGVSARSITKTAVRDLGRNVADSVIKALNGK